MSEDQSKDQELTETLLPFHRAVSVRRINCFALLVDLEHHGKNNTQVANDLGVPRTTLRHWKAGREPCYSDGCRLIEYHSHVCLLGSNATQNDEWPHVARDP